MLACHLRRAIIVAGRQQRVRLSYCKMHNKQTTQFRIYRVLTQVFLTITRNCEIHSHRGAARRPPQMRTLPPAIAPAPAPTENGSYM
jgi:hypothetical protein